MSVEHKKALALDWSCELRSIIDYAIRCARRKYKRDRDEVIKALESLRNKSSMEVNELCEAARKGDQRRADIAEVIWVGNCISALLTHRERPMPSFRLRS